MKNLSLTTLLILITLGFSSCTQDDNILLEEPTAEDLLKSFNLNKNAKGDYSLDYQLGTGAAADNVLDTKTNTNNIYLYSSDAGVSRNFNESLSIQGGQFNVNFNDTDQDKIHHMITVLDDDIKSRGEENENLESWGMTGNGDGTFDLNFVVRDGIGVDFIYDGDRNVYEVHLTNNQNASQSDFVQTFTKEEGVALNVEFVNYTSTSRTESEEPGRRPKVIIN